jgi:hypothetical protein
MLVSCDEHIILYMYNIMYIWKFQYIIIYQ